MASGFSSLVYVQLGGVGAGVIAGFRNLALIEVGGIGGSTTLSGTLNRTNANDTLSASGTQTILGTLGKTNANDTISASGGVGILTGFRSLVLIEVGGVSTFGGQVSGTVNFTNANDVLDALGTVPVVVVGIHSRRNKVGRGPYSLGRRFRPSRIAFTHDTPGVINVINSNDTLSATGFSGTIVGTLSLTTTGDSISASGGSSVSGTLNKINNDDTLSASGKTTVNGTMTATNANDTLNASGVFGNPPDVSTYRPLTGVGQ